MGDLVVVLPRRLFAGLPPLLCGRVLSGDGWFSVLGCNLPVRCVLGLVCSLAGALVGELFAVTFWMIRFLTLWPLVGLPLPCGRVCSGRYLGAIGLDGPTEMAACLVAGCGAPGDGSAWIWLVWCVLGLEPRHTSQKDAHRFADARFAAASSRLAPMPQEQLRLYYEHGRQQVDIAKELYASQSRDPGFTSC